MLLVRGPVGNMNLDEREEGEITEYEDISSDEEILLRQRIAEIEATNLELEKLATLTNKVDEKGSNGQKRSTEIVALVTATAARDNTRRERRLNSLMARSRRQHGAAVVVPKSKARRRSRRLRKHSCQLIVSDDEFDSYDALGTENLSPDPLPEIVDDDEAQNEEDDDLELKLRLEALQSKQEIKNDLKVILLQTKATTTTEEQPIVAVKQEQPVEQLPPALDEEQELRLIALKSAIVKKHLVRKKRREEARPYSPTDDTLESFDVPSPPLSVQNMDISPFGTPSPLSENNNPVDMEIANEESESPIFFSCMVNTEPTNEEATQNGTALSRVEVEIDRSTMVPDSGYDDEDPDKLRAFLLEKIGEAAKRKAMRVESDSLTDANNKRDASVPTTAASVPATPEASATATPASGSQSSSSLRENENSQEISTTIANEEEDNEHILRANLLSKAKRFKKAEMEADKAASSPPPKPLSEILSEQSKKAWELKSLCRTIENNLTPSVPQTTNLSETSVRATPPPRSALISELRPIKVAPVVISLNGNSSSEFSAEEEEDEDGESLLINEADNLSPMSIAMDSPQYSSSPLPATEESLNPGGVVKKNFDVKLSEFLKKARQSVTETTAVQSNSSKAIKRVTIRKPTVSQNIARKAINIGKTVGLTNVIQLGAPAAVKHLPPSTQMEYNRLINRMHQLERQKLIKTKNEQQPKAAQEVTSGVNLNKSRPSPVKAPPTVREPVTVIRRLVQLDNVAAGRKVSTVTTTTTTDVVVPVPPAPSIGADAMAASNKSPGGRITLKDRLKSLTAEQTKMLLDVQQRKVVNKRKLVSQSLDTFLDTLEGSVVANRQQIRMELEMRRLRKLMKQKEQSLAEQRQLCNVSHEKLQSKYKAVILARQSLSTTSSQCMDIGRSTLPEDSFRLTSEGSEGLGEKFRRYKEDIETYKDLRQKIKKGVFTVADVQVMKKTEEEQQQQKPESKIDQASTESSKRASDDQVQKGEDQPKVEGETEGSAETIEGLPEVVTATAGEETVAAKREAPLLEYKSPLEHMEYLDTANPNGILCPFQLNGTCQDGECSYRHLMPLQSDS